MGTIFGKWSDDVFGVSRGFLAAATFSQTGNAAIMLRAATPVVILVPAWLMTAATATITAATTTTAAGAEQVFIVGLETGGEEEEGDGVDAGADVLKRKAGDFQEMQGVAVFHLLVVIPRFG